MTIDAIIGAVLPFILEYIFKWIGEKDKIKFVVSLIIPLLVGGALNYQSLSVGNVESILASGAIIFAAAQGVYKLYLKDSKVQKIINR